MSEVVSGGNVLFTLIGFCGLYFVLGCLYLFLMGREIAHGPKDIFLSRDPEVFHDLDLVRNPRLHAHDVCDT